MTRITVIAALTLGSFTANLCGHWALGLLLLGVAVAELCHGIQLLRAQQTPLGRAEGRRL